MTLKGHVDQVDKLVVYQNRDKNYLISNSKAVNDNPSIILWELPSGIILRMFYCTAFSIGIGAFYLTRDILDKSHTSNFSGDVVVNACVDGTVNVWSMDSGAKLFSVSESFSSDCESTAFCVYSDKNIPLVAVGAEDSVSVWNLCSGEVVSKIKGSSVMCVVLVEINNPILLTNSFDLYDILSGKAITTKSFDVNESLEIGCCQLHYNGNQHLPLIFAGMTDGSVIIYDFDSCAIEETIVGHASSVLAISSDDSVSSLTLITGGIDNKTNIWNGTMGDGLSLELRRSIYPDRRGGHAGVVLTLKPAVIDGQSTLFSGGEDSVVIQWNLDTAEEVRRFEGTHILPVNCI